MRKIIIVFLWIILILTPVAAVNRFLPGGSGVVDYFIGQEWAHVIAHMGIFFGLGVLLTWTMQDSEPWVQVTVTFLVIVLVGLGQEAFQLFFKGRSFSYPELFDLFVDLGGGFSGIVFSQVWMHIVRRVKILFIPQEAAPDQHPDTQAHSLHQ